VPDAVDGPRIRGDTSTAGRRPRPPTPSLDGFRTARFRVNTTAYQPAKPRHDMAPLGVRLDDEDDPDNVEVASERPRAVIGTTRSVGRHRRLGPKATGAEGRPAPNTAYKTGSTRSVSNVDDTIPPITTVARGRCTSAPTPVLSAIGTNPIAATAAGRTPRCPEDDEECSGRRHVAQLRSLGPDVCGRLPVDTTGEDAKGHKRCHADRKEAGRPDAPKHLRIIGHTHALRAMGSARR
jgi:hypothetical protein